MSEVMTRKFSAVRSGARVSEAIEILSHRKISELPVIDGAGRPIGMLDITDVIGLITGQL
jgi:arabinose-5-phosphate isomerase